LKKCIYGGMRGECVAKTNKTHQEEIIGLAS